MEIRILDRNSTSVLLFNAIAETESFSLKKFNIEADGDDTVVNVSVYVNGVEVDFVSALMNAVNTIVSDLDNKVKEKAQDLLKEKIGNIVGVLTDIENNGWKLEELINN